MKFFFLIGNPRERRKLAEITFQLKEFLNLGGIKTY